MMETRFTDLQRPCHHHLDPFILLLTTLLFQDLVTQQTMTAPAAPPPLPAVWGRETVTLTPTVLGTWCVAPTTVQLDHPHWTVVNKVRKTLIDKILI